MKKIRFNVSVREAGESSFFLPSELCEFGDEKMEEIYQKKLIAAIRRAGGRCTGYYMDGCRQPDGYHGTYGMITDNGLSVDGRFSVEQERERKNKRGGE